jgi:broad specificity phosphatase PhoE
MTRLYLIRHGRPAAAWGGGDDDPGLDPEGRRQAIEAARVLGALPSGERPTTVASSPLRRCRETAAPFAEALGVELEIVADVGEIPTPASLNSSDRGPWLRQSLAGRWTDIRGDIDYELWRRRVFEAVKVRPGAAIFSHFVALNAVLSLLDGDDSVISFRPDHVSMTVLETTGEGLRLVARGREAATSVL